MESGCADRRQSRPPRARHTFTRSKFRTLGLPWSTFFSWPPCDCGSFARTWWRVSAASASAPCGMCRLKVSWQGRQFLPVRCAVLLPEEILLVRQSYFMRGRHYPSSNLPKNLVTSAHSQAEPQAQRPTSAQEQPGGCQATVAQLSLSPAEPTRSARPGMRQRASCCGVFKSPDAAVHPRTRWPKHAATMM